ncbi:hypothetical protein PV772_19175 [Pseudarthrobacter sp. CC12]|uniref:hypothetical protein n=1 Tax=Pseudarthrobacter sp. CC12 TaxID=3029193 RepID=UPI003267B099
MSNPETLSYQLPGPLPPHLRGKTATQRRAAIIFVTGAVLLLVALLALVLLLLAPTTGAGNGQQTPTPATATTPTTPALTPTLATTTGL